ncbi:MAG: PD40 domain-containing protein [Planctomycetes bacterium]|nr:PD40 domain-containing protein [Planctomycetota bacterium]
MVLALAATLHAGEAVPPPAAPVADAARLLEPIDLSLGSPPERPASAPGLLAFAALAEGNWDIYTWDFDAQHAPRRVTDTPFDESHPALAADGSFCIFETVDGKVWRAELKDGGEARPLPHATDQKFDMHPAVSPDGASVALAASLNRATDDTDLVLYHLRPRAFGDRLELLGYQHYPAWAPDSLHLAYANLQARAWSGTPISEIWVLRADRPWARQLTLLDALSISPSWSPTGAFIAFACNRGGNFDLWAVDPFRRGCRRLTTDAAADTDPAVSPDGRSIIFVSTRGGELGLWRLQLDLGNDGGLSHLPQAQGPAAPVLPFGAERVVPCRDPDWR